MFGGKGRFVSFYETGDEIFEVMCGLERELGVRSFFVMDENFLLYRTRALRLLELMRAAAKPWSLYVFSSANTLRLYSAEELVGLGISWVWLGLEGKGGSTVVYTGTSLLAPERVIRRWNVPGLDHDDVARRSRSYAKENNVHLLPQDALNDNNRLFVLGSRRAGYDPRQFPVNVKGCRGASLCNLGCPGGAKQGTHRVQLPRAEARGVRVVTRASVVAVEDHAVRVHVAEKPAGAKGEPSEWRPGDYRVGASAVVLAAGAVGSPALLLRSHLPAELRRLGHGFTCHPAQILVAEHPRPITNDVGHPKSFYVDRAVDERFVLETRMYFPFTTAKSLPGFGEDHGQVMRAFSRLQMILVLACDRAKAGNRVGVDRAGRPVVHYAFDDEVVGALVAANRAAARIFFAAGAERVHVPLADPSRIEAREAGLVDALVAAHHFKPGKTSVSAAHLMGGCGMGRSALDSVTDAWGRVHGLPWLRVADASLFPDALEINPYLTIMALADRVAEKVLADAPALFAARRARPA
jgi:choline dehydrogenase-like flavoprotein